MAIRLHRQSAEVTAKEAAQTDLNVRLFRLAVEVLGGEPTVVAPIAPLANLQLFLHNWRQQVKIDTSWSTDVRKSKYSSAEERTGLLAKPQRRISVRWTPSTPGELDYLVPQLKRISGSQQACPLYSDQTELDVSIGGVGSTTIFCDTTDRRFYPGALITLAKLDGHGHQTGEFVNRIIADKFPDRLELTTTVANVTAKRTLIYPLLTVEINLNPRISYETGSVSQIDLTFQEVYGPSTLGPLESGLPGGFAVYQGFPIWNFEPDWSNGIEGGFLRDGDQYQQGLWQQTDLEGDRERYQIDYPFLFERFEALDFLRFFDSRRGRLIPFWHVDQEQVWAIESQSNSDTELNITATADFTEFQEDLDYIGVVMMDGTVHVREVTDIDDETSTFEVTMESAIPSLDLANVRRVARARVVRFARDSVTENWTTTEACNTATSLLEVLDEEELTL